MLYLLHIINQKSRVVFNGVVINNIIAIAPIMPETTTIQITKQTREELRKIGKMGDDYNKVINDLIIEHNRNKLGEYGENFIRAHKDEFVSIDDL
jgi:hypothetical protein